MESLGEKSQILRGKLTLRGKKILSEWPKMLKVTWDAIWVSPLQSVILPSDSVVD